MTVRHVWIVLVLLIILTPSIGLGLEKTGNPIKTGYDLYSRLSTIENTVNNEEGLNAIFAAGFMQGVISTLHYVNVILFVSERKISDYKSYNLPFSRINFPENLPLGQVTLMYLKWAKAHPEELNLPAHTCLINSLREAYGDK